MGQDEVWWSSPAEVQRVALGIVSGAGVRVLAAGAWWRPPAVGWTAVAVSRLAWERPAPRLLSGHALFT